MDKCMTSEKLASICRKWQKILRLQDWDIFVEICRKRYLPDGAQGNVKIDLLKKKAVIAVMDEIDCDPSCAWSYNPEQTLVHELLHLHFETNVDLTNEQYVALEQGVDILSKVLMEMADER